MSNAPKSTTLPVKGRLDERSRHLRNMVIDALEGGARGHPGAALSLIEILRVLYGVLGDL